MERFRFVVVETEQDPNGENVSVFCHGAFSSIDRARNHAIEVARKYADAFIGSVFEGNEKDKVVVTDRFGTKYTFHVRITVLL